MRVRLTLWYVALLALILSAFSGAVYVTLAHALNQQVDDNLALVGQQVLGLVNSQNGLLTFATGEGQGAAAGVEAVRARGFVVRLLSLNGQVLVGDPGSGALPLPALGPADWQLARPQFTILSLAGGPFRSYTVFFEENGRAVAAIQVAHSLQSVAGTLSQLLWAWPPLPPLPGPSKPASIIRPAPALAHAPCPRSAGRLWPASAAAVAAASRSIKPGLNH